MSYTQLFNTSSRRHRENAEEPHGQVAYWSMAETSRGKKVISAKTQTTIYITSCYRGLSEIMYYVSKTFVRLVGHGLVTLTLVWKAEWRVLNPAGYRQRKQKLDGKGRLTLLRSISAREGAPIRGNIQPCERLSPHISFCPRP